MRGDRRTRRMPPSRCAHCESCYFIDEAKGKLVPGYMCILDEWDEYTYCRKGGCKYYRYMPKLEPDEKRQKGGRP